MSTKGSEKAPEQPRTEDYPTFGLPRRASAGSTLPGLAAPTKPGETAATKADPLGAPEAAGARAAKTGMPSVVHDDAHAHTGSAAAEGQGDEAASNGNDTTSREGDTGARQGNDAAARESTGPFDAESPVTRKVVAPLDHANAAGGAKVDDESGAKVDDEGGVKTTSGAVGGAETQPVVAPPDPAAPTPRAAVDPSSIPDAAPSGPTTPKGMVAALDAGHAAGVAPTAGAATRVARSRPPRGSSNPEILPFTPAATASAAQPPLPVPISDQPAPAPDARVILNLDEEVPVSESDLLPDSAAPAAKAALEGKKAEAGRAPPRPPPRARASLDPRPAPHVAAPPAAAPSDEVATLRTLDNRAASIAPNDNLVDPDVLVSPAPPRSPSLPSPAGVPSAEATPREPLRRRSLPPPRGLATTLPPGLVPPPELDLSSPPPEVVTTTAEGRRQSKSRHLPLIIAGASLAMMGVLALARRGDEVLPKPAALASTAVPTTSAAPDAASASASAEPQTSAGEAAPVDSVAKAADGGPRAEGEAAGGRPSAPGDTAVDEAASRDLDGTSKSVATPARPAADARGGRPGDAVAQADDRDGAAQRRALDPRPASAEAREPKAATDAEPHATPFDTGAAVTSLMSIAMGASSCIAGQEHGVINTAHVVATFESNGRVSQALVDSAPYAGTGAGECLAQHLRGASVKPFTGGPVTVRKTVQLP